MKQKSYFAAFTLSLLTALCIAHAQSDRSGADKDKDAAENARQRLKEFERGTLQSSGGGDRGRKPDGAGEESAAGAGYLGRANQLKDFRKQEQSHGKEARRLEALNLIYAELHGVTTETQRTEALVAEVRQDAALPAADRFSVASLADLRALSQDRSLGALDRANEIEATVRALTREFPGVADAYEGYLRLADDTSDERAVRIARDVLTLPAPTRLKTVAQGLLDRYALVDQPIDEVFPAEALGSRETGRARNRMTILYTWSMGGGSWIRAQQIADEVPTGAEIIGVNLDTDAESARRFAEEHALAGSHVYSDAGRDSPLARKLGVFGHDVVLIANRSGIITSVSGRLNFSEKLEAAK